MLNSIMPVGINDNETLARSSASISPGWRLAVVCCERARSTLAAVDERGAEVADRVVGARSIENRDEQSEVEPRQELAPLGCLVPFPA